MIPFNTFNRPLHVIGLTGYAGTGKSAAAQHLTSEHGYTMLAFADPLKLLTLKLYPEIEVLARHHGGIEVAKRKEPTVRAALQNTGQLIRECLDVDAWVNALAERMRLAMEAGHTRFVIPDVRYPNEARFIRDFCKGSIFRIERPGYGPCNAHTSETSALHADLEIVNDDTLDMFEWTVGLYAEATELVAANKASDLADAADFLVEGCE